MKQFFKIVLGSMVGFIVAAGLFTILMFIIIAAIILSSKKSEQSEAEPHSVLTINLNKPIAERMDYSDINFSSISNLATAKNLGLKELTANIRKAKNDEFISGIFIDTRMVESGWATLEALRRELIEFKKSKKFIIAYGEVMTQKSYYIASVADKVYLNPSGLMEFSGMSVNIMFLKGTLDKLGIEPQIFYCGKFKSATEPLRLTKMSDANRLQTTEFINSFYSHFMKNIADSRKMNYDSLDNISKELLVRNPASALKYGLVDGLKYYDEVLAELKKTSGTDEKNPKFVSIENYDNMNGGEKFSSSKNKIAVVYAEGDIVDGQGDDDNIGGEKFAEMIRKIRQDEKVKALVIRVNSPGGSALASDIMWREIMLAKKKMPVVISMGNYAASGGYYISCAADSIFTEPNTLTGSIGVFGILPCMENFLHDKLGITHDGVKTGKYSDMPNLTRHLNDDEKRIIQAGVDTIYSDFLNRVAQGRHKTKAEIDSIAQGRVWSGEKAISIGLVDKLGNLDAAIACAVRAAKVKDFSVTNYPSREFGVKEILYQMGESKKQSYIKAELGEYYQVFEQLQFIKKWNGVQARLPFEMDIR
ncbi:MAG: hypothetical protein RJA07_1920 [Bacteroidota bacterium]|jgi:protease-4